MTGHRILGITQMDQTLFEVFMVLDGIVSVIKVYHVFQNCPVPLGTTKLPVCLSWDHVALDGLLLEVSRELFAVCFRSTVKHELFWWSRPSNPSCVKGMY